MIDIHATAKVSPLADLEDSVRGTRIVVGPRCMIDSFVKFKPAGGSGDVVLGERVMVNSGCVFYTGHGIRIGNHVAIAANCTFAPCNHAFGSRDKPIADQGFMPSKGGIVIEDDVWIGANCVLLDGAHLAQGCVLAAGSVLKGRTEPFGIYAGSPARRIAERP